MVLQAAEQCPKNIAYIYPKDMEDPRNIVPGHPLNTEEALRALVDGNISTNRKVLDGLLVYMDQGYFENYDYRHYVKSGYGENCQTCIDWSRRSWYKNWERYEHSPFPPNVFISGPLLWASGVAEAATVFELMAKQTNALRPLKDWSERFLPQLNESIVAFERRLHEEIFGRL
jgi:hypothetical protein